MSTPKTRSSKPADPTSPENMGTRIRQLREGRGLTCEQFGRLCGVTKAAVSFWENGQTENIRLKTFRKVLEVLGTQFDYLVYGPPRGRSRRR